MKIKEAQRIYSCPHCQKKSFKKKGYYYRKISKTYIPRYVCLNCKKHFSTRTVSATFRQKRPDLNKSVLDFLTSGVSLRRTAQKLGCHYETVYRKFLWLSTRAEQVHRSKEFLITELQIDEMESIEHTKLKPLSIALAVSGDYQILGVKVGTIPAKGLLAQISKKKYGIRQNQSNLIIDQLLQSLKTTEENFIIKSDAKPSYQKLIKKYYPHHQYEVFISSENKEKRRELKYTNQEKRIFDPIFALNQRIAKFRDHIKRLNRRSWCTTKIKENLEKHIYLYIADNNNYQLI